MGSITATASSNTSTTTSTSRTSAVTRKGLYTGHIAPAGCCVLSNVRILSPLTLKILSRIVADVGSEYSMVVDGLNGFG